MDWNRSCNVTLQYTIFNPSDIFAMLALTFIIFYRVYVKVCRRPPITSEDCKAIVIDWSLPCNCCRFRHMYSFRYLFNPLLTLWIFTFYILKTVQTKSLHIYFLKTNRRGLQSLMMHWNVLCNSSFFTYYRCSIFSPSTIFAILWLFIGSFTIIRA